MDRHTLTATFLPELLSDRDTSMRIRLDRISQERSQVFASTSKHEPQSNDFVPRPIPRSESQPALSSYAKYSSDIEKLEGPPPSAKQTLHIHLERPKNSKKLTKSDSVAKKPLEKTKNQAIPSKPTPEPSLVSFGDSWAESKFPFPAENSNQATFSGFSSSSSTISSSSSTPLQQRTSALIDFEDCWSNTSVDFQTSDSFKEIFGQAPMMPSQQTSDRLSQFFSSTQETPRSLGNSAESYNLSIPMSPVTQPIHSNGTSLEFLPRPNLETSSTPKTPVQPSIKPSISQTAPPKASLSTPTKPLREQDLFAKWGESIGVSSPKPSLPMHSPMSNPQNPAKSNPTKSSDKTANTVMSFNTNDWF